MLPHLAEWQERNGRRLHSSPKPASTSPKTAVARFDAAIGFNRAFLGIETPVGPASRKRRRGGTLADLLDSVKKIQSYGIEVMAGFIVGLTTILKTSSADEAPIREAHSAGNGWALNRTAKYAALEKAGGEGRLLRESAGSNTHSDLNFIAHGCRSLSKDTNRFCDRSTTRVNTTIGRSNV
jgi:hypothetical protein